jgi:hypothetical protein
MLQPCAEQEIPSPQPETGRVGRSLRNNPLHLHGELGPRPLIRIEQKEPWMLEVKRERGVAVCCVVIEDSGVYLRPGCARDVGCGIGGVRIEDVYIIRPGYGRQRSRQVVLLVSGEDEDGDGRRGHLRYGIAVSR